MATSISILAALAVTLNAVPDSALTKAFVNTSGWTGGDAAYSVPLAKNRSLWLFGDTFIGRIEGGVRRNMTMVHNTAGWLDRTTDGHYRFKYFWPAARTNEPKALIEPISDNLKTYYWPAAFMQKDGRLAIFCKTVRDREKADDGFGFDWVGAELVLVDTSSDEPTRWRLSHHAVPGAEVELLPGSAVVSDEEYTYIYANKKSSKEPGCYLLRVLTKDLIAGDMRSVEYFSQDSAEPDEATQPANWQRDPLHAVPVLDGASEMSVTKVSGLPGYWCVYNNHGLSAEIVLRHADKPEGPWTEPQLVYRVPEATRGDGVLCYGAKHHPELSTSPRELVITYCLNPGAAAAHRTQPMLYFPRAIRVTITPRAN